MDWRFPAGATGATGDGRHGQRERNKQSEGNTAAHEFGLSRALLDLTQYGKAMVSARPGDEMMWRAKGVKEWRSGFAAAQLRRDSLRPLCAEGTETGLPSRSPQSGRRLVELSGIEPLASSLRTRRSPN